MFLPVLNVNSMPNHHGRKLLRIHELTELLPCIMRNHLVQPPMHVLHRVTKSVPSHPLQVLLEVELGGDGPWWLFFFEF